MVLLLLPALFFAVSQADGIATCESHLTSRPVSVSFSVRSIGNKSSVNAVIIGKAVDLPAGVLEKFSENPQLDGRAYIPPNLEVTGTLHEPNYPEPYEATFQTGSIRAQRKEIRNLLKDIKRRASERGHVEYGAILIEFENGSTRVLKFTSNNRSAIGFIEHNKAFAGSRIMAHHVVRRVIHIHTHPPRLSGRTEPIIPSIGDYISMKGFEAAFTWSSAGPNVEGIVLPTGTAVNDVLFLYRADGMNPQK